LPLGRRGAKHARAPLPGALSSIPLYIWPCAHPSPSDRAGGGSDGRLLAVRERGASSDSLVHPCGAQSSPLSSASHHRTHYTYRNRPTRHTYTPHSHRFASFDRGADGDSCAHAPKQAKGDAATVVCSSALCGAACGRRGRGRSAGGGGGGVREPSCVIHVCLLCGWLIGSHGLIDWEGMPMDSVDRSSRIHESAPPPRIREPNQPFDR
jgi:hypothetical protein